MLDVPSPPSVEVHLESVEASGIDSDLDSRVSGGNHDSRMNEMYVESTRYGSWVVEGGLDGR